MDRRTFVSATAALVGTGLAGCSSSTGGERSASHTTAPSRTDSSRTTTTAPTTDCVSTDEKVPDLRLLNQSGEELTVQVMVTRRTGDGTLDTYYEETHDVGLGGERTIELFGRGVSPTPTARAAYVLTVRVDDDEATEDITGVARSPFRYGARVELTGQLQDSSTSTASGIRTTVVHAEVTTDFRTCTPTPES